MEHYITGIHIDGLHHVESADIELGQDMRKHLILTGQNGTGKTTLFQAIRQYLSALGDLAAEERYDDVNAQAAFPGAGRAERAPQGTPDLVIDPDTQLPDGIILNFSGDTDLLHCIAEGKFIMAYFPADRQAQFSVASAGEKVIPRAMYGIKDQPAADFLQYLSDMKMQETIAQAADNHRRMEAIRDWFARLETAMQHLMADPGIRLCYDAAVSMFYITRNGDQSFGFHELSGGYSSVIWILADLLMRVDPLWLQEDRTFNSSAEGIVLIDELEAHLHLEVQRSVLPALAELFPNLQFIVTTHSPFVVTSLKHAVIYDLGRKITIPDGLSDVTYEGAVEGYFHADTFSRALRRKYERYEALVAKTSLTDDEYDEIMSLEQDLDHMPAFLSGDIAIQYRRLKLEFQLREDAK
ncbi:MAG: AAA family ATPase [Clostridia bacterium]|nr:AAA family ATPase [Clostridia bacterium]